MNQLSAIGAPIKINQLRRRRGRKRSRELNGQSGQLVSFLLLFRVHLVVNYPLSGIHSKCISAGKWLIKAHSAFIFREGFPPVSLTQKKACELGIGTVIRA